jgi:hypothetical protein
MTEEIRIGPARAEQFARHWIHFHIAIVAEYYVEMVVSVGQRTGHVVESNLELRLLLLDVALGEFALSYVGIGENEAAARDRRVSDVKDLAVRELIFELMRLTLADALHA